MLSVATLFIGVSLLAQEKTATSGLSSAGPVVHGTPDDPLRDPQETYLRHVKQLTFGGQNAEAYFSYDGRRLIFMSTREPYQCDQTFVMNADGSDLHLVSPGKGRTTCGYYYPDGNHLLYSSTHLAGDACPPRRIIRMATFGPSIPHTKSTTRQMTEESSSHSQPDRDTTPRPRSPRMAKRSCSLPRATEIWTSTP